MNWAFDFSLLGAPLLVGLVVTSTHVLLGREVLKRGIIFIDLTIAQIAALGVLAESLWHPGNEHVYWHAQLGAVGAALAAALLLAWTEKRWPELQEALIGSLYVIASSAALLLIANHPHGDEQLTQLLAGQILWVNYERIWPVAILYAGVLSLWFLGARRLPLLFYVLFAVTVTAS
ncbi:MAG: metal ABC transporter permease, partial [Nevskiales bacterium]